MHATAFLDEIDTNLQKKNNHEDKYHASCMMLQLEQIKLELDGIGLKYPRVFFVFSHNETEMDGKNYLNKTLSFLHKNLVV